MSRVKPTGEWLGVMLCVNDERGHDAHRVRAIDVEVNDDTMDFEAPSVLEDPSCLHNPSYFTMWEGDRLTFVKVGHLKLTARNHRQHVGNICWSRVEMPRSEVKRLVSYLMETRAWSLTYGPEKSDLYPGGDFTLANRIADARACA